MKYTVRDPTHAARRLLSKPWHGDPSIDEVITAAVTGKQSPTRMVENSPDIKRMFNGHATEIEGEVEGRDTRNLQYCKSRFDSLQKPLSRFILVFKL